MSSLPSQTNSLDTTTTTTTTTTNTITPTTTPTVDPRTSIPPIDSIPPPPPPPPSATSTPPIEPHPPPAHLLYNIVPYPDNVAPSKAYFEAKSNNNTTADNASFGEHINEVNANEFNTVHLPVVIRNGHTFSDIQVDYTKEDIMYPAVMSRVHNFHEICHVVLHTNEVSGQKLDSTIVTHVFRGSVVRVHGNNTKVFRYYALTDILDHPSPKVEWRGYPLIGTIAEPKLVIDAPIITSFSAIHTIWWNSKLATKIAQGFAAVDTADEMFTPMETYSEHLWYPNTRCGLVNTFRFLFNPPEGRRAYALAQIDAYINGIQTKTLQNAKDSVRENAVTKYRDYREARNEANSRHSKKSSQDSKSVEEKVAEPNTEGKHENAHNLRPHTRPPSPPHLKPPTKKARAHNAHRTTEPTSTPAVDAALHASAAKSEKALLQAQRHNEELQAEIRDLQAQLTKEHQSDSKLLVEELRSKLSKQKSQKHILAKQRDELKDTIANLREKIGKLEGERYFLMLAAEQHAPFIGQLNVKNEPTSVKPEATATKQTYTPSTPPSH